MDKTYTMRKVRAIAEEWAVGEPIRDDALKNLTDKEKLNILCRYVWNQMTDRKPLST